MKNLLVHTERERIVSLMDVLRPKVPRFFPPIILSFFLSCALYCVCVKKRNNNNVNNSCRLRKHTHTHATQRKRITKSVDYARSRTEHTHYTGAARPQYL